MFSFIFQYYPVILQGLANTLIIWISSATISIFIGTTLGIANSKKLKTRFSSIIISGYISLVKGIPAYVQILIAYFVIPEFLGINIPAMHAAIFALGICSGGYVAEIIRAGINSVSQGQWDACFVLGYSKTQTLKNVIFPQATKNILPALIGELDQLIKTTSILAAIGVLELTRAGMNIISRELNPAQVYLTLATIYLIISQALNFASKILEKRLK